MPATELTAIALQPGEGSTVRVISDLITTKALAADTGGAFSLFETQTQPGAGTPPHVQRLEEESFYILDGTYTFLLGDLTIDIGPGGFVMVPRGTVHAFTNSGKTVGRMLILITPGGIHERFFADMGEPVDAPLPEGGPDIPRFLAIAEKYGLEVLPPA